MNPTAYRVAAMALVADQAKSAPKKVDDLFKEVKDGNPGYSDEQAWATAWSIYCKHVDPNGDHCHKSPGGYLKEGEAQGSIERPTPTAVQQTATEETAPTPEESHWNHWEKRGEWNLNVYKRGSRWDYFMKNPKGGGGGSTSYSSMGAAIAAGTRVGWGNPHINPEGKTRYWLTILKWDPAKGQDGEWLAQKSEWKDVPKEMMTPPKPLTDQEHWERATR